MTTPGLDRDEDDDPDGADGVDGFAYSNLSDRAPGRLVTVGGLFLPGIARVQADAAPFAAAWEAANRAALREQGPLWVALGDSLSQGLGAPSPHRGWVGQLHDRLAAAGTRLRLVNLSVSGARTQDVLDRQLPALARVAAVEPDLALVTLMIGSNDIVSRRHRAGLAERVDRIVRQLPPGSLVTTLPNPSAAAEQANSVIAHVAERRGLVVAELRDPRTSSWRGKLAADHFHPNELGYAALTDVVFDALRGRWPHPPA